jgi:hypothetical protein
MFLMHLVLVPLPVLLGKKKADQLIGQPLYHLTTLANKIMVNEN